MKAKQFGLIRSGTNFTKTLLEENCDISFMETDIDPRKETGYWKHGNKTEEDAVFSITTIRHPLSWLFAVYRYDWQEYIGFKEWLHNRGVEQYVSRWRVMQYIPLWGFAYEYWRQRTNIVVRFEDFLNAPSLVISEIATENNISFNDEYFSVPGKYVGPNKETDEKHFTRVKERELSASYLDVYDKEDINYVLSYIDPVLLKMFGYTKEGTEL